MATQHTSYGYQYPEPTDDVLQGAANIAALAQQLRAPELFSGQPCLAGSMSAQGGDHYRIRHIVYNYQPATDQYGLLAIPLPFSVCCVTATIQGRNFREPLITVVIAQEYCTVTNLAAYARGVDGNGLGSVNVSLTINAWGF